MISLPDLAAELRSEAAASAELRDRQALSDHVARRVLERYPVTSVAQRLSIAASLLAELTGLGPLDELLADDEVDEVLVNCGSEVWVERRGQLVRRGSLALGQADVLLERILAPLGRRADRLHPIVDARLPDGSRVSAVLSPLAVDGTSLSIRRFRLRRVGIEAFASPEVELVIRELVDRRCNLLVTGATSTGKTTFLNALASRIAAAERIITVEDIAELRLLAEHVVRLECRPATAEGDGAATVRDLVRCALRLRPDRLIVGEVRGAEAMDMLQALNTGHDGSMSTCHANSPVDGLRRLEAMVLQAADALPLIALRDQIHSSIDAVIHLERLANGARRVREIVEVADSPIGERVRVICRGPRVIGDLTRSRNVDRASPGDVSISHVTATATSASTRQQ